MEWDLADPVGARNLARAALDPGVWAYLERRAGGDQVDRNLAAWEGMDLRPRILRGVGQVDTSVTVLGRRLEAPILTAPNGRATRYHPDGERAVMAGAQRTGVGVVIGSSAGHLLHALSALASPPLLWSQVYLAPEEDEVAGAVERAVAAGCHAIVATVDLVPGRPSAQGLPPLHRPDWEPDPATEGAAPLYAAAGIADLERLVRRSPLPVVVKGVLRADDARICVEAGAAGLIVSNHGDAQLAGAIPSARALRAVAGAVGSRVEVYVDGGIRDGAGVVRALALGARAVLVGRPVTYGLAVAGEAGVETVIQSLCADLKRAMALCGAARLSDIDADLIG